MPTPTKEFVNEFKALPLIHKSRIPFSHTIFRGRLRGSTKTWICKEMPHASTARIELLAQEFFRMLIPQQPETRIAYNSYTGVHYIFSEEVAGFRELPPFEAYNFTNYTYTGLGQVLVVAMLLQETDLKIGNIGLNDRGMVIKIDGDHCFSSIRKQDGLFNISSDTIANLPYAHDFYANNWLDFKREGKFFPRSSYVDEAVQRSQQFRTEVNQALLKICLLPDFFIECLVDAYIPAGGEIFADLLKNRRNLLRGCVLQDASFREYLTTPDSINSATNILLQMKTMIADGEQYIAPLMLNEKLHREVNILIAELNLMNIYTQKNSYLLAGAALVKPRSVGFFSMAIAEAPAPMSQEENSSHSIPFLFSSNSSDSHNPLDSNQKLMDMG